MTGVQTCALPICGFFLQASATESAQLSVKSHGFRPGQEFVEVRVFRQKAHFLPAVRGQAGFAEDGAGALRGPHQPQQGLHQRGFSGSVGTDEAVHLPLPDAHVHPAHGVHHGLAQTRLEGLVQVDYFSGGRQVKVSAIDGAEVELDGKLPALLVSHTDKPGVIALVSSTLASASVNIATMRVFRKNKGGLATMVLECDQKVQPAIVQLLAALPPIDTVRFVDSVL